MIRAAETDFLPWILGALVAATTALALIIHAAPNRPAGISAAPTPQPMAPVAVKAVPPGATPAGATSASGAGTPAATAPAGGTAAAAPATPLAAAIQPIVPIPRADLPPGQVYECNQRGQHIFSDSPCGERAAIRQLSEVNRMTAVAVTPDAPLRAPPRDYSAPEANYPPPAQEQPQSNDATVGGILLYPVPVLPYRYREHEHERHPQNMPWRPQNHPPARDLGSSGRN